MSCIYGSRQYGTEHQGWIAHFARSVVGGEPLTIYGDGKQVRDALFVDDLVRAYDAFLSDPASKPAVYNVGGGPEYTASLLELIERLEAKTKREATVRFEDWREGDQRVYVSDIGRARDALGWQPATSIDDGLDAYLDWIQTHEHTPRA